MAKEKEDNLWRGKIYFPKEMKNGERKKMLFSEERKKPRKKRRTLFGEGKSIFCGGEEKQI